MLRVVPGPVPSCGRVAVGQGGAQVVAAPAPDGLTIAEAAELHIVAGAPNPAEQVVVVNRGLLAVSVAQGVARSYRLPRPAQVHDRRPPGLLRIAGADAANACLLCREADWSAVVLPSLGDIATGPSIGQVAIRADGLEVAAITGAGVAVHDLAAEGAVRATHEGAYGGIAYTANGQIAVGAGAAVGPPGTAPAAGSPVVQLAAAAGAPRVLARHADGTMSVWSTEGWTRLAELSTPVQGPANVAMSADGTLAALGAPWAEPAAAAVHRVSDGALIRYLAGVRSIAFGPEPDQLLIGGDWGIAWLDRPAEAT